VVPDDLKYTREHEWIKVVGERTVRVGITQYAQEALGDVVFVTVPAEGTSVEAGQAFGEVESTKSVSDLYAPLAGTVTARNETLESQPELVNSDPYGEGWMVEIELTDPAGLDSSGGDLLGAAEYTAHISG
jgi:glycine cleavage system H protein